MNSSAYPGYYLASYSNFTPLVCSSSNDVDRNLAFLLQQQSLQRDQQQASLMQLQTTLAQLQAENVNHKNYISHLKNVIENQRLLVVSTLSSSDSKNNNDSPNANNQINNNDHADDADTIKDNHPLVLELQKKDNEIGILKQSSDEFRQKIQALSQKHNQKEVDTQNEIKQLKQTVDRQAQDFNHKETNLQHEIKQLKDTIQQQKQNYHQKETNLQQEIKQLKEENASQKDLLRKYQVQKLEAAEQQEEKSYDPDPNLLIQIKGHLDSIADLNNQLKHKELVLKEFEGHVSQIENALTQATEANKVQSKDLCHLKKSLDETQKKCDQWHQKYENQHSKLKQLRKALAKKEKTTPLLQQQQPQPQPLASNNNNHTTCPKTSAKTSSSAKSKTENDRLHHVKNLQTSILQQSQEIQMYRKSIQDYESKLGESELQRKVLSDQMSCLAVVALGQKNTSVAEDQQAALCNLKSFLPPSEFKTLLENIILPSRCDENDLRARVLEFVARQSVGFKILSELQSYFWTQLDEMHLGTVTEISNYIKLGEVGGAQLGPQNKNNSNNDIFSSAQSANSTSTSHSSSSSTRDQIDSYLSSYLPELVYELQNNVCAKYATASVSELQTYCSRLCTAVVSFAIKFEQLRSRVDAIRASFDIILRKFISHVYGSQHRLFLLLVKYFMINFPSQSRDFISYLWCQVFAQTPDSNFFANELKNLSDFKIQTQIFTGTDDDDKKNKSGNQQQQQEEQQKENSFDSL